MIKPFNINNTSQNYAAAKLHLTAWLSIKAMFNYMVREYGPSQVGARASQGGHTSSYVESVLQILPREDISTVVAEAVEEDIREKKRKKGK